MDLRPTSNAAAVLKDLQPSGAEQWRAAGRVAPQSQSRWGHAPSSRLAIDPPLLSAPLPIYEMDSNLGKGWIGQQVAGSQRSEVARGKMTNDE